MRPLRNIFYKLSCTEQRREGVAAYLCMEPSTGVDYYLGLGRPQSRLQHIYHGQPYARVDLIPMPESTLSPS